MSERNILQAAATLRPLVSQQRSHPQSFHFLFPILKVWTEFILNYSMAGHHPVDNAAKKNETYEGVGFFNRVQMFPDTGSITQQTSGPHVWPPVSDSA